MESRQLLATFPVTTTADAGPGSLRDAIVQANARTGADNIVFAIPASTAPGLDVPVAGFDPTTQTWRIRLASALPALTDQVTIDGLTEARFPVPYRYPEQTGPDPILITSAPSSLAAKEGNNAVARVIVDGSQTGGSTGFDIRAAQTIVRGLNIEGFGVGVSISGPDAVGALVQGNSIGRYFVYPVDPGTGEALSGAASAFLAGAGNAAQGVLVGSSNATVGGPLPQETNIIGGNGAQGVFLLAGAVGNLVVGNQIGVAGPTTNGLYSIARNGAEGVRVETSGAETSSSTTIDLNLISANVGDGIHVVAPATGPTSTRINITGNYIGTGPGGGFLFGSADAGNLGDGIRIENAAGNRVGGSSDRDRNVISDNQGAGVRISGTFAAANTILGNFIGVTAGGDGPLGNSQEGVALTAPGNTVGPGNLISANLRGVLIFGSGATGNVIRDNLIGTDLTGQFDRGNAREGIRIDGAANNQILGNGAGSQVVSGNNVGVLVVGGAATRNLIQGNLIGTTGAGNSDLGNSLEGVRIEAAPNNTVGGTTTAARNLISANHWGVTLTGAGSLANLLQGNLIGTDLLGNLALGNELDGVLIREGASGNTVGGSATAAGNTIAFNHGSGVLVQDSSVNNAILTDRIFGNGGLAIDLAPPTGLNPNDPGDGDDGPNRLQNSPVLTSVDPGNGSTRVQGVLNGAPNSTFTIQFFALIPPESGRPGEGGNYLGEATVATDAAGNASFSVDLPAAIAATQRVSATATDPLGNTSEFSGSLTQQPTTISFATAGFTVAEAASVATIVVTRSGGTSSPVTVSYATADGTARAGSDYQPASGTLSFGPGETTKTFTIPILFNPETEGPETVLLTLSNPTGGASLAQPASAVLSIVDDATDRSAPSVVSARAVAGRLGVAAVILTFSEPLDPARAVDLVNYGYSVRIAGRDGRLGTRDDLLIGIVSASYDPATRSVTLLLGRPILKKTAMRVAINQATDVAGAGVGVSDVAGNLLDGDGDGRPGGAYVTKVVARPVPVPVTKRPRVGKPHRPGR